MHLQIMMLNHKQGNTKIRHFTHILDGDRQYIYRSSKNCVNACSDVLYLCQPQPMFLCLCHFALFVLIRHRSKCIDISFKC